MCVYHIHYSELPEIIDEIETRRHRKCYNVERFPEILRELDINEGVFVLPWNLGIILFLIQRGLS